jgi:hypothetical protein
MVAMQTNEKIAPQCDILTSRKSFNYTQKVNSLTVSRNHQVFAGACKHAVFEALEM